MESTPGEDAVKIVEVTTKDLECYINLVVNAVLGLAPILSLWFQFSRSVLSSSATP